MKWQAAVTAVALVMSGGWPNSGTVVGKGYDPPHTEPVCTGKQCRLADRPECWRLDFQWWIFSGWTCAPDKVTWERVRIGDWYQP